MAESGWLTRSLEQPYPYDLDYNGKISNKVVKEAFLKVLDFVEKNPTAAKNVLRLLLAEAITLNFVYQFNRIVGQLSIVEVLYEWF
jgi:DNA (cytosine-5)-methyltransferase 1